MKFAIISLLVAALAIASPAPAPDANAEAGDNALVEARDALPEAYGDNFYDLESRDNTAVNLEARDAATLNFFDERDAFPDPEAEADADAQGGGGGFGRPPFRPPPRPPVIPPPRPPVRPPPRPPVIPPPRPPVFPGRCNHQSSCGFWSAARCGQYCAPWGGYVSLWKCRQPGYSACCCRF